MGRSSTIGRSSPLARRSTSAIRSPRSRQRRATRPRKRRAWSHVDYEELPAVFTVAGAAGTPTRRSSRIPSLRPERPARQLERAARARHRLGRRRRGDGGSRRREHLPTSRWSPSSRSSRTPSSPRPTATASRCGARSSTRTGCQRVIARVLGLPLAKVRVYAPDPGGAFGGKQHAKYEPLLCFMALKLGRPVRLVLTLEETFVAVRRTETEITRPHRHQQRRHASRSRTSTPTTSSAPTPTSPIASSARARTSATARTTGRRRGSTRAASCRTPCPRPRSAASAILRSTGQSSRTSPRPRSSWASTRSSLRCATSPSFGDRFVPFDTACDGDWAAARGSGGRADRVGQSAKQAGRGRGIALGIKSGPTTGLSYSLVRLLADGSALVYAGTQDMGQGARTIFAQMCAAGARRPRRARDRRQRRHRGRAVRPADVSVALDRADGQRSCSPPRQVREKLVAMAG